jgi:predicted RNase H-like HicB family nuclease
MPDSLAEFKGMKFPVIIEKGEDGYYVVECQLFDGCLSQGKTIEEALVNIKEVIEMCLEEEESRERARKFKLQEVEFLTVTV